MNDSLFQTRHIGPSQAEAQQMLQTIGCDDWSDLIDKVIPPQIRLKAALSLSSFAQPLSEVEALAKLRGIAQQNKIYRSYIGMGYHNTIVPSVIQRNILENPSWYTAYTPYQPEISQGRLEALLNYQTMVSELTALPVANASLLDEATAAAEAMGLALSHFCAKDGLGHEGLTFAVSETCHPQTIAVVQTRAEALGVTVLSGDLATMNLPKGVFGVLMQYPDTYGAIINPAPICARAHQAGALAIVACDLLALTLLTPPGELGADIAIGTSQRFGVPLGYGGPHAAFFAVKDEFKRTMPGRLIGVSKDCHGQPALRLSLQTREQHIRREKATSNICTAQVLLAVMASMYAVYHGPFGLRRIALQVNDKAKRLAQALTKAGFRLGQQAYFDTLHVQDLAQEREAIVKRAQAKGINLRIISATSLGIALDETAHESDLKDILSAFCGHDRVTIDESPLALSPSFGKTNERQSSYLNQEVFQRYHTETEFLRYVKRLESRDISLATSMIALGSCTMKLNATSEMLPITWPEFADLHPFAPREQSRGYTQLFTDIERALAEVTGFAAVSLQPNAGSQGEYAGLLVIRAYLKNKGENQRKVCLIPRSAHGTNPASAVMAGMQVVVVNCDERGNVDMADLKVKAEEHRTDLAALMVTYPSTHGVFEEAIKEMCAIVHACGGQVYMDGANLNAQVGLCAPAEMGADVCHINLHKTFCIPHGGGGPGMGPIAASAHLAPFLPGHPLAALDHEHGISPVSAAPWGSAAILPIPWMYMALMGGEGLTRATKAAILNANYVAKRLDAHYPVLYRGTHGFVAHECIIDLRPLKKTSGIEAEDVAKRLMDYGFHAPTVSFPVVGTLMIEPTESESKAELDRFCEAMISIREEIREVEQGSADRQDNVLKHAPHTAACVIADQWTRPYAREKAAYPASWTREHKVWPSVGRIDAVYGDRNLICTCGPVEEVPS